MNQPGLPQVPVAHAFEAPQSPAVGRAPILLLDGIRKSYNLGTPVETEVLHGISLALQEAEFVALKGPSGFD